jgi:hypothetical protein
VLYLSANLFDCHEECLDVEWKYRFFCEITKMKIGFGRKTSKGVAFQLTRLPKSVPRQQWVYIRIGKFADVTGG